VETLLTWFGDAGSSVEDHVAPARLVEELQDGQDVASQVEGVCPANGNEDSRMVALLGPPCHGKVIEVIGIVGDNDPGLLKRELKLSFVGLTAIAGRDGRQTIESVSAKKCCQ
jgi:hypothetical protein